MFRVEFKNIPTEYGLKEDVSWFARVPVAGDFVNTAWGNYIVSQVDLLAWDDDPREILDRPMSAPAAICTVEPLPQEET